MGTFVEYAKNWWTLVVFGGLWWAWKFLYPGLPRCTVEAQALLELAQALFEPARALFEPTCCLYATLRAAAAAHACHTPTTGTCMALPIKWRCRQCRSNGGQIPICNASCASAGNPMATKRSRIVIHLPRLGTHKMRQSLRNVGRRCKEESETAPYACGGQGLPTTKSARAGAARACGDSELPRAGAARGRGGADQLTKPRDGSSPRFTTMSASTLIGHRALLSHKTA